MKFNLSGAPADPFFTTLQRRHPDVDLVLLPPEPPMDPDVAITAPEARLLAGAAVATIAGVVAELWPGPPSEAAPVTRMRYGVSESEVRAAARVVLRPANPVDGVDALEQLVERLLVGGWQPRLVTGEVARLTARRDGVDLRATVAPATGVLVATVGSDPVVVGVGQARELVRGGAR